MRHVQKRWAPAAVAITIATALTGCPDNTETDAGMDTPGLDTGTGDTGMVDGGGVDGGGVDGGGLDAGALPTNAPTTFTSVASTGFVAPTDAVVSPDGATFYFAAFDATTFDATIFRVPADGSAGPTAVHSGAPLEYPSGLVLSADGATIYVADPAADSGSGTDGVIFSLASAGGAAPTALTITGAIEPNAVALNTAGDQIYFSGRTTGGIAGVFRAPRAGGAATALASGAPLVAPTGLHLEPSDVVWVLDHLAEGSSGPGVLFSITTASVVTERASGLSLGTPGGVSLAAGGGTVVVGSRDDDGTALLRTINTSSGASTTVALPGTFIDPAGLRSARAAGVFALVDSEGSAIYRGN